MADNTRLNIGTTGDTIRTEDIGGVKFPVSKIVLGNADSNDGDVSASNPLPTLASSISAKFLSNTGGSSYSTVKSSSGNLWGWQIQNPNASTVFVQIFNSTAPTVGTTAPMFSLFVPASGGIDAYLSAPISFTTGITLSATTTATGGTAPGSAVNVNAFYS